MSLQQALQQSLQLIPEVHARSFPPIQRGLYQIGEQTRLLANKVARTGAVDRTKASSLLAKKGFDPERADHDLQALSRTKPSFEPLEPLAETDLEGRLQHEHDMIILTAIEESKQLTIQDFEDHLNQSMLAEWETSKHELLQMLGQRTGLYTGTIAGGLETDPLSPSMVACADIITRLTADRSQQKPFPLCTELLREAQHRPGVDPSATAHAGWTDALPHMCFSEERRDPALQERMLTGALGFLEQQYAAFIRRSATAPIRGADDPWALVFYCMRCGDFGAALEQARALLPHEATFLQALEEYRDTTVGARHRAQERLRSSWARLVQRPTGSDYQMACHLAVGRCDPTHLINSVFATWQDYVWLKLRMVGPEAEHSLSSIQAQVAKEWAPSAAQYPWPYFQIMLLTLQFERAVLHLSSMPEHLADGVHFALALAYYGLLREQTDGAPTQQGVEHPSAAPRVNTALLVRQYVRAFARTNPRESLHYYLALSQNLDTVRLSLIRDLILETREADALLGCIQADGNRQTGYLGRFLAPQDMQALTTHCALYCEAHGRYAEAAKLFDLAGDHAKVIRVLVNQLCQHLRGSSSERASLLAMALAFLQMYRRMAVFARMEPGLEHAFVVLVNLASFFDYFAAGQWAEALALMHDLGLLPLDPSASIEAKADSFRLLDEAIRRNMADVLLATMQCLYSLYGSLKPQVMGPVAPSLEQQLGELRNQAQALVTFAGAIQAQLPGDTSAQLVRMAVLMN
ncbi:putative Nuclear pore complex protein Nup93 [Paratrimastix pyriformis]|uniref:Nuclear pore protein n=1 Tax=Paratrimastix pyriformis TaxID=342808 RepID=A0ABQ8UST2_9EUKA|nr:putative Nuclear pore complex protein Nup93 [Paratrimastix pyriformis]